MLAPSTRTRPVRGFPWHRLRNVWFITMERSCQCQLLAEAAGKPIPIDHENAALTRTQLGTHEAGWFQFQPLWSRITREQPDLFH